MKILIATGIYPPDIGGPATILKSLVNSFKENKFEVQVLTYSISKYNDEVHRVIKNKLFSRLEYFFKMMKLAKWCDVIYVTDVYSVGFFAYLMKKMLKKKYIVRFAGDAAWEMAVANNWTTDYIVDFQNKTYGQRIEHLKARRKKILVNATKVIAVSNFMVNIAKLIGVREDNIVMIYNSIDFMEDKINQEAVNEIKQKFGQDCKIISTACRLVPWKGVGGIIKIIPQLKEKIGQVNFLVLGDGQELDNLQKLASELQVSDNVQFLGKVEHDQVINYLAASDLFILNTHYEGLSHTLLEAIKAETPIIATNIGGNPEVITNNQEGLLINYNNEAELLAASLKILSDKQLATNFVIKAKEKLKQFNWDKLIKQTTDLIRGI